MVAAEHPRHTRQMPSRTTAARPSDDPVLLSVDADGRTGGRRATLDFSNSRPPGSRTVARRLVWAAVLAGTLHAAFSLYWATGGTWLLDTVGDWAVDLGDEQPLLAGIGLGLLGTVKLAAAWVPLLVESGRVGARRRWRRVSWAGGLALVAYGGSNTVVALAVVTGVVHPAGGYDSAAMLGHAALWDPLFLVWGVALLASLWVSRDRAASARRGEGRPVRGTRAG
jgi:hypothetical protein